MRPFMRGTDPSGYGEGFWLRVSDTGTKPGFALDSQGNITALTGSFDVIEMNLWEEMDSSAVESYGKYNVMAGVVDFATFNPHERLNALASCGWEMWTKLPLWRHVSKQPTPARLLETGEIWCPHSGDAVVLPSDKGYWACLAETMWSYGARDIISDESGNNLGKLMRAARGSL